MRIALGIEYDGTAYSGWQRQRNGVGVQSRLEEALSTVADEPLEVTCAGRTDAGVHAIAQVGHFDTRSERCDRGWLLGTNSHLPDDISVRWIQPVEDSFHARFSALSRSYRYCILNRLVRSALNRDRAWWVHKPLDAEKMHAAAQSLIGEHDFSAFRAAGCQARTPVREIQSIEVRREGDHVLIEVSANAFLQHMVRNITGLLVSIGAEEMAVERAEQVLISRDRTQGGMAAPPQGLTLIRVLYPSNFGLPGSGE